MILLLMLVRILLAGALAMAVACKPTNEGGAVLIEVQTDFVPGLEFRSVRVSVAPAAAPGREIASEAREVRGGAAEEAAFRDGLRIAELGVLSAGSYRATAVLRDDAGAVVAQRTVLVDVGSTTRGVRIVLSRVCVGLVCPGAGPTELTECEGGRCVDPRCGANGRDRCPVPSCTGDAMCVASASCATGACTESGSCLVLGDSSRCAAPLFCHPEDGCVERVVPPADGGVDGGFDAGTDAGPPWDPDTDPALLVWFRFEETGISHPGTPPGDAFDARCINALTCPSMAPGVDGQALSFDGVDDRLEVTHAPSLLTAGGFTISAWVALASVPAMEIQSIVAKPFGASFRNSWQLALIDTDSDDEGEIAFAMDDASSEATAPAEVPASAGSFVLVTGAYDGTTMRLYVNGASVGTGVMLPAPLFDTSDVLVGADSNSGSLGDYFTGVIDDVRLYARALRAAEVMRLYEVTR